MHIGIDIRSLASPVRTGVGEYTFELLNALFAIDTTNQYYLFANARKELISFLPRWNQSNVHYTITHHPNKLLNFSTKLFNFPKIDRVIIRKQKIQDSRFRIQSLDFFFSPNLNFTALSPNTKHILTIHDLSFAFFPHFFSKKQRLWHRTLSPEQQCRRAAQIVVPSKNTKRDLVEHYHIDAQKIAVIHHGVSSLFTEETILPREEAVRKKYTLPNKFILFLGTIEPRKNIPGLIEGFELATAYIPEDVHLVIAGSSGWQNEPVFKRLANSPFKNRITHIGYVEPRDKPFLYRAAELFIYPSFYEGFGFPVIEAMKSATPVITSNRSSLPEIGGSAVYYCNPNKPFTIAKGICNILMNPELKNRFVKSGLEQSTTFSWQQSAEQFLTLLQNT